jgi:hypothetical protein
MKRIIFFSCILSLLMFGCKKKENPVEPGAATSVESFDLTAGKTWIYRWSMANYSYDSAKVTFSESDTFIVRIASTNDSLKNFTNLVRFEAQSVPRFVGVEQVWYKHDGDSLVEIAYKNIFQGNVLPKIGSGASGKVLSGSVRIASLPRSIQMLLNAKGVADSILFRGDIRVVYKFPLEFGKNWTSFTYPFLQTREVVGQELLSYSGKQYPCVKIATSLWNNDPNVHWYDYVSNDGLIKRSVVIDSLLTTTTNSPDGSGGYSRFEEYLELMN